VARKTTLTLVVLNLADVATDVSLRIPQLVGTDLEETDTVQSALAELIRDCGIVNYASPKLVDVLDNGVALNVVFRMRTASRALAKGFLWQSVDARLPNDDRKALDRALETERP